MHSPLLALRDASGKGIHRAREVGLNGNGESSFRLKADNREIMEDNAQKSCWGLTAKAVIGFAGVILLVWLIGGSESAAVLATAG
jgi:hypothetical protein